MISESSLILQVADLANKSLNKPQRIKVDPIFNVAASLQQEFENCFARTQHLVVEDGQEVEGGVTVTRWWNRTSGGGSGGSEFEPLRFSDCSDYTRRESASTATWRSRPVRPRVARLKENPSTQHRMSGFFDVAEKGGWFRSRRI